jgi:hypothetical protein
MNLICKSAGALAAMLLAPAASAALIVYEAAGANAAAITPTRDAFRTAVGGGTTAGANGSFGGLRREINWDGVPDGPRDPNLLPADFFNVNSPRGAVFSTPGQVSWSAPTPARPLRSCSGSRTTSRFQRRNDCLRRSNSNITDVTFFVPGTAIAATTSAFAAIFVDVEVAGLTTMEFFDPSNSLIFSRNVLAGATRV